MSFSSIVQKCGFSGVLSIISLLMSFTCFIILARISYQESATKIKAIQPQIVKSDDDGIKVPTNDLDSKINAIAYDNITRDIDKIILENTKESEHESRNLNLNHDDTVQKIALQAKAIRDGSNVQRIGTDSIKRSLQISSKSITKDSIHDNRTRVQIAAFRTHSEAVAAWFRLRQKHRNILDHQRYTVYKADNESLYRLQIITDSNEKAKNLCTKLKTQKIMCFTVEQ